MREKRISTILLLQAHRVGNLEAVSAAETPQSRPSLIASRRNELPEYSVEACPSHQVYHQVYHQGWAYSAYSHVYQNHPSIKEGRESGVKGDR
jgi:hypothetical protein